MYSIDQDNNIKLVRGDYFAVTVNMTKDGEDYTPSEGSLRFAVKKSYRDPDASVLINKAIPLDTRLLELESSDTKVLAFGAYVYDIEYTDPNGRPDTFIRGKLKLIEEVV